MKRKTRVKRIPKLPSNATEEKIVHWITRHDAFDRLDARVAEIVSDHSDLEELLESALFEENTAQLNMRIPLAMKTLLARMAKERTTDASTLGRIWLAERMKQELRRKTG